MENKIGLLGSTMIVIANMVGVGIFTSLGFQLLDLTDYRAILIMWFVGGLLALTGTLCYSELSATFPRSGGEYHFLNLSFGKLLGYLSAWTSMLVGFAAPIAAAAHAFSKYLKAAFDFNFPTVLLGVTIILIISLIQSINTKVGTKFQVYFTLGKIGLIVLFIIGGFWFLSNDNYNLVYNNLKTGDLMRELLSPGFWIGSIFVSYAYSGWNATSYIIEDIENPKKNVLKSTVYGTLIVTCLYCLLTFIFLASSPASEMAGKEEIGYIAAVNLFGSNAGMMISSAIAFFLISSISAMTIVGPRVLKRVNQDYQLLKLRNEEKEDPNKPPRWALKIQTLISVVILASSSFDFIITSMGFLLSIFTTLTAVGVIILRVKERDRPRPWKVPLYPITPLIYCIFNFWVIYYVIINRPASAITGFVFLVLGLVTYYYLNNKRSSRKAID